MSPDRNGNDVLPVKMQTTYQTKRSAQDSQLCSSVGMEGWDRSGTQEGSASVAETWDDGYSGIRDTVEM